MNDATQWQKIRVDRLDEGAIWHVWLDAPKGNVIDSLMSAELTSLFESASGAKELKAIILEGSGPHFSFGASVEEHMPEKVANLLKVFHGLFRAMARASVPTLAVVRGQCLGGGLELAAFCNRLFASADAQLGQPEIRLGVFAPVASLLLPERMRRRCAEDLCLTGRVLDAKEAYACGLVDDLAGDPQEAALHYARTWLLPHSASSLRHAVGAVRRSFHDMFFADLDLLEQHFVEELMKTADAEEGIVSFLEKREPVWRNE